MAYPSTSQPRVTRPQPPSSFLPADFFGMLWRKKAMLLVVVTVFLVFGVLYILLAPKTCMVTARLLIRAQGMPTEPDREPKTSNSFLATQAEIIHSPAVLERALKSLDLPPWRGGLDPRVEILKLLTVRPMGGTDILSISYKAPAYAQPVETIRAIIAAYGDYLREAEQGSQLTSLSLMTDYEKGLRQELDTLGKQYLALHKANASLVQERESTTMQQAKILDLSQQLRQARLRRVDIESRLRPSARPSILAEAKDQEEQLQAEYLRESQRTHAADDDLLKEQQVLAATQRLQAMYDSVVTQVRQLKLADQALASGRMRVAVSVLEGPLATEPRVYPPPLVLLPGCGLLGLTVGLGIALLLERLAAKVRSPQQVQDTLGLPVLAGIPTIAVPRGRKDEAVHRCRQVCQSPDSTLAHAVRALRTRLIHSLPTQHSWIVQLVSPVDGEGKSTVAANLACSFAQLGKNVVLVDADLRRGWQHRAFDVPEDHGLSSVLHAHLPLEAALARSPLARVDILARGPNVGSPAELLAQPEFDSLLVQLRQRYDVVLLDGPPLLTEAGALILATKVDAVVLCLRAGRSSLREAERACELLENLDKSPWGVVVSQVSAGRYGTYYEVARLAHNTEEQFSHADFAANNGQAMPEPVASAAGEQAAPGATLQDR